MLSPRQKRVFDFIRRYFASNNQSPTLAEIARFFQYRSITTVHRILEILESEGLIKRTPHVSRGIEIVTERKAA
jgi:repressor LexA